MLIGNFYTLSELKRDGTGIHAKVELNPGHEIFKGHFPSMPIVPGVCQIQMLVEIINVQMKRHFVLETVSQAKFLSFVNPNINRYLTLDLEIEKEEPDFLLLSARFSWEQTIFLKFRGTIHEPAGNI